MKLFCAQLVIKAESATTGSIIIAYIALRKGFGKWVSFGHNI